MALRIYAKNAGRTLRSILKQGPDLVYYAQPNLAYPTETLVVDYDLHFLNRSEAIRQRCAELADLTETYDTAVLNLPRYVPLAQTNFDICAASRIVAPAGRLLVIVPEKSGEAKIELSLQYAFGEVASVSRKPRVYECAEPLSRKCSRPLAPIEHHDDISGVGLRFSTRPGLFSPERIDRGTLLLLQVCGSMDGDRVLDVACGYGAIGAVAAARGAHVDMMDCDCRAVTLARSNLGQNCLTGTVQLLATLESLAADSFDRVLSNPPTHRGSRLLQALFQDMMRVRAPGGRVVLVFRRQLHYEKWLISFGRIAELAAEDGYKVLEVTPARP